MPIPAHISIVTLGVADLERSMAFYAALGWIRSSASNDDIVWFKTAESALGLFPAGQLAADAGVDSALVPSEGGFRGVTLAINLGSRTDVDAAVEAALAAGGTVAKPPQATDWGGYSGYFADPDGHLWELAHNPFFPLDGDGRLQLP